LHSERRNTVKKQQQRLTVEQCRNGYWDAAAHYEAVRRDAYSSYAQIAEAAAAVARWRNDWVKAVRYYEGRRKDGGLAWADAVRGVCSETGEDVAWALNNVKRA
jgi:hypothetical protein